MAMLAGASARAKELEVIGRASVPISQPGGGAGQSVDVQAIRAVATREAKRAATITAIDKVLGPNASSDPRVSSKIDAVLAQLPDDRVVDTKASRVGSDYQVVVSLVLDDKEFRTLLSDLGIAIHTATARACAILSVMDEFLTTPRDVKAPLEELVEFGSEQGASFRDRSAAASAHQSSAASTRSSAGALEASASDRAKLEGSRRRPDGGGTVSGSASTEGSLKVAQASSASSAVSSTSKAVAIADVAAEEHDNQRYRKLVKYQPQGGTPEKTSQAYNALMGQLQDYDLRVVDNDVFRSKYFGGSPLTLEQMQNGEALARYVAFAKSEANADFFLVGNSIIIDAGKNPNTGDAECTAVVTVKTYATAGGEAIASETFSEASAGRNLNDCAATVAKKIAAVGGPVLGARIQEYWKRRMTYGREFVVTLTGTTLPLMVKTVFTRAVKGLAGVESDTQRLSNARQLQVVVTYKGTDPLDQAVAAALVTNPAFANLDSRTDGNQVFLCMGPCAEVEQPAKAKKP